MPRGEPSRGLKIALRRTPWRVPRAPNPWLGMVGGGLESDATECPYGASGWHPSNPYKRSGLEGFHRADMRI